MCRTLFKEQKSLGAPEQLQVYTVDGGFIYSYDRLCMVHCFVYGYGYSVALRIK